MPSAEVVGASLAGTDGPSLLDVDIGGTFTDAFVVMGWAPGHRQVADHPRRPVRRDDRGHR